MRKKLIAANWKMHPHPEPLDAYNSTSDVDVIVFPTFLDLSTCIEAGLTTGAQYGHPLVTGAHTGDISMKMIAEQRCTHVLCGHSERRANHHESNEFVAEQTTAALENNVHPILCIGETWEEREAGKGEAVVQEQLETVLKVIGDADITVAYEPVWAISGGDPNKPAASAADAQTMHAFIRGLLPEGKREETRILYGGSMKPENCEELLAQPDIDGGLVGGASLVPEKFTTILQAAGKN